MAHDSPLVRQWIVLKTLSARRHGVAVQELAVSEKTVRRDLEAFVLAGFPLEEQLGEHGRKQWRLDPAKYQPGLSFAFDEALALHLLEPLAAGAIWDVVQRAVKKLRSNLGKRVFNGVRHLDVPFSCFGPFHRPPLTAAFFKTLGREGM
jgi:predicted DNA-binding transcriptional regulator YafY